MQLHTTQLTGLLGAIMISSGLASPMALAARSDEASDSTKQTSEANEHQAQESTEDMVEVRISLPDGRTVVRLEPKARHSANRSPNRSTSGARKSSSGVRSTGGRSSGGSASSSGSSSSGASHASGGSSGGGNRSGGGGSASGGSAGASSSGAKSSQGADLSGAQAEGSRSGVQSVHGGSTGTASTSASAASSSTRAASSQAARPQSVPTIGAPQYSQDGATGGQRVEFRDVGMGASVIGNTVYFNGIEHVRADQMFDVVTGTKMGGDMVIMQEGRLSSGESGPLSSWNTGASAIKIDFPSDTIVTLTMLSRPTDSSNPERIERTWTVRIR